ncbi:MAG: hypothetical protein ACLFM5_12355 [Spirochaetaceae bacterium]
MAPLVLGLWASCDLLGRERSVTVELPPRPSSWPSGTAVDEYRLQWRGEGGTLRERYVDDGERRVEVRIPKRDGVSVLVFGRVTRGDTVFETLPAGAVYPHDEVSTGVIEADHERGFTALVLHRVLFALPSLNVARFLKEVEERAGGNPWLFDLERVVTKLEAGSFSAIYLRPRDEFDVTAAAAPGLYLPDNPLVPSVQVVAAAEAPHAVGSLSTRLPPGRHAFHNYEEGTTLVLFVDEDGSCRTLRR